MRITNLLMLAAMAFAAGTAHAQSLRADMPSLSVKPVVRVQQHAPLHIAKAADEVRQIPYLATFVTEEMFSEFTVINANADYKSNGTPCTWYHNPDLMTARYSYSGDNQADDWLISPPVYLEAGAEYKFTICCKNFKSQYYGDYEEKFEVKLGQGNTVEAMTQQVMNTKTVRGGIFVDFSAKNITVAESGNYNLGIHCVSDAYRGELDVKNIRMEVIPKSDAPAAVTNFVVTPNANGDPAATVSFQAPTKTFGGADLTGTMSVFLSRNGALIHTFTDVAPGQALTYIDSYDIPNGDNTYQLLPANQVGQGAVSEVTAFVGVDVPLPVASVSFAEPSATQLTIKWDPVSTVGANGHVVNPENVGYAVFSTLQDGSSLVVDEQLGFVVNQTSLTISNDNDAGTQRRRYWIVVPVNIAGTGDYTMGAHFTGRPHSLPFEEHLTATGFTYPTWIYSVSSPKYVILDLTDDASDGDNLALLLYATSPDQWGQLCAGKVSLDGADNPTLLFDVKAVEGAAPLSVSIVTPDATTTEVLSLSPTSQYQTVKVNLSAFKGERYVLFEVRSDFPDGGAVAFDNFHVVDVKPNDLMASIQAPETARLGICDTHIALRVKNVGDNEADGFQLKLYADNRLIGETSVSEKLPPLATYETSFLLPFNSVKKAGSVTVRAEVEFASDEALDNNAAEAVVRVVASTKAAPVNLTSTETPEGIRLAWEAPATDAHMQVEDFEDEAVFPQFGFGLLQNQYGAFGDWTVYDGDDMTNYGFNNYSFPGNGSPSAWQVFRPGAISDTFLDEWYNYEPHSGDQYMVAWCPNDGSAADNWLISPMLSGQQQTISFHYAVLADQYGPETFEVLASSSDRALQSFTLVQDFTASNMLWDEAMVSLPEGTRYFALRHTSEDVFGLMIDDVAFTAGGNNIVAYNIYVDGIFIGTTEADSHSFSLQPLSAEPHTVGVTAFYEDDGESSPAYVKFNEPTGITTISNVPTHESPAYNLSGQRVNPSAKGLIIVNGKKVLRR